MRKIEIEISTRLNSLLSAWTLLALVIYAVEKF